MHVGTEQRSDASRRWFILSQTGLPITPSPSSILPSELHPLVRGRTVPQRKRRHPPHPLEKVFSFSFRASIVCHVTSRALVDYAECHHLLRSGPEGVRDREAVGGNGGGRGGESKDGSSKERWGCGITGGRGGGGVGRIDGLNGNSVNCHHGCEVWGSRVPAEQGGCRCSCSGIQNNSRTMPRGGVGGRRNSSILLYKTANEASLRTTRSTSSRWCSQVVSVMEPTSLIWSNLMPFENTFHPPRAARAT